MGAPHRQPRRPGPAGLRRQPLGGHQRRLQRVVGLCRVAGPDLLEFPGWRLHRHPQRSLRPLQQLRHRLDLEGRRRVEDHRGPAAARHLRHRLPGPLGGRALRRQRHQLHPGQRRPVRLARRGGGGERRQRQLQRQWHGLTRVRIGLLRRPVGDRPERGPDRRLPVA